MDKRGQVTIFIIIAILVIGAVALFLTLRGGVEEETYSPEVVPIANFVQECLEDSAGEVIQTIGEGGGYHYPPKISTDIGITYYFYNNKSYMPPIEEVENEISKYATRNLILCLGNFVDFPEYEITKGKIKTNTEILENEVLVKVNYPLTIKKGEYKSTIKDFETEIPVRLGVVYDSVNEFMLEDFEQGVCLSCLLNITMKNDLYVDSLDYDNETKVFIFRDDNSIINEKSFEWIFANKY